MDWHWARNSIKYRLPSVNKAGCSSSSWSITSETPENCHRKDHLHVDVQRHLMGIQRQWKRMRIQCSTRFSMCEEIFHQEKGHSSDLDQTWSGILSVKIVHKVNGTESLNKWWWNSQKADTQVSVTPGVCVKERRYTWCSTRQNRSSKREYHMAWNAWKRCCKKVDFKVNILQVFTIDFSEIQFIVNLNSQSDGQNNSAKSWMNLRKKTIHTNSFQR